MRKTLLYTSLLILLAGCAQPDAPRERLFSDGWRFVRDSIADAISPDYDDSSWLAVDLPHDFSLMELPGGDTDDQIGPFSRFSPGNTHTGPVMGGNGWYRKTFTTSKADEGKRFTLLFDGAYMETDVWVNGQKVGDNRYGYSPFAFDITAQLNAPGEKNVVSVRVGNIERNSRWYTGSGIYRDVTLIVTDPVHVDLWGVQVTTPVVSDESAEVDVAVTLCNDQPTAAAPEVSIVIVDATGACVAKDVSQASVAESAKAVVKRQLSVGAPALWSPDSPALYKAVVSLSVNGKPVDSYSQTFGIRTLEWSAEKGFLLNGQQLLMKGGCMHHDNGFLGAAAIKAAERHRVQMMKDNGYNAIRCSHNPPSQHFLDACDEIGVVVLDEFVDMWNYYKNTHDYARFFNERWESDLTRMLLRDRNHPSIVMWSIGNEIPKASIEEGVATGRMLKDKMCELDGTRPVTEAIPLFLMWLHGGWEVSAPFFDVLDIGGYNYMETEYEKDHNMYPERIMVGTESYPLHAYENWKAVERLPYVIGDFVWTALDYIGEVLIANASYGPEQKVSDNHADLGKKMRGIHPKYLFDSMNSMRVAPCFPNYISWCGDIDIIGVKKPQGRYRDVLWDESVIEMNVHEPMPEGLGEQISAWGWPQEFASWNWEGNEGRPLQVRVFTKAAQVRLELNGETVGERNLVEADKYIATFDVPYQPGTLTAVALNDGQEVGRTSLVTTGEAVSLKLTADRSSIGASRSDLAYVRIDAVDGDGRVVPDSDICVDIDVVGDGQMVASGNAFVDDMKSVNRPHVRLYRGQAQAIVRPFAKRGSITVNVTADGLEAASLAITVE